MAETDPRTISQDISDGTDEAVQSALGVSEVYRGEPVEALNIDEFKDNAIDGTAFDVWDYDPTDDEDESPILNSISNIPGEVAGHRKVDVTGGLTRSIGAAVNFQNPGGFTIGLSLILDANRIVGEVVPIEYGLSWFDRHPGVMARVETLADGEVRVDGDLMGLVDTQAGSGNRTVNKWGRERMEARANSPTYRKEDEIVAMASEIDLDGALKAAVGYYNRRQASGGALEPVLNEQDGFSSRPRMGSDAVDTSDADDRELTKWLYRETVRRAHLDERYIALVVTQDPVSVGDTKIAKDNFSWVYDGSTYIEDYEDARMYLGRV